MRRSRHVSSSFLVLSCAALKADPESKSDDFIIGVMLSAAKHPSATSGKDDVKDFL
jgi:hypothetical protein